MSHLKKNDVSLKNLGGVLLFGNVVFVAVLLFAVVFEVLGLRKFLQSICVFALKCVWEHVLAIFDTRKHSNVQFKAEYSRIRSSFRRLESIRRRRLGGSVF